MHSFIVEPLTESTARTAFPLIRAIVPALTIAGWLDFVGLTVHSDGASAGGIIVARASRTAYPVGLATWRRERGLDGERILVAEHVVALDLLDVEPIVRTLSQALDAIALRLDCDVVQSRFRGPACDLAGAFTKTGYVRDGFLLHKPVPAKPTAS